MIIVRTPLRISFAGGGSDFREFYAVSPGLVISTAINKYTYITVHRRFDEYIRVCYSQTEIVKRVSEIKHNIVREALKMLGIKGNIDIVYTSDLPPASVGTGLGASSSIAVGLLHALHVYKGEVVSKERLAEEACRLEIEILKQPIGKQDQYAVAHGGFNEIVFHPDERTMVTPVAVSSHSKEKLLKRLLLFYTGLPSRSEVVLKEQKKNTPKNRDSIGHMVALAKELSASLRKGKLERFGEILHENWMHKKTLARLVSNKTIDRDYTKAISAGATGGKILGSGGGGFLLFYCEEKKQPQVRKALKQLREMPFAFESSGSQILYVSE